MKITILSSLPPIKGISKYTAGLLEGLSKNKTLEIEAIGFKKIYPESLYPGGTKDKSLRPVKIPDVKIRPFLTWYNPFGWVYAGLTAKGEIIHAQWWSYVLAPMYFTIISVAKFIRRKKIIITVHNVKPHEQGMIKNFANKSILKLGDRFIVHSENNKSTLSSINKIPKNKIDVVPHGVLLPETITGISKNDSRQKLGIPTNAKVILFFGIIREYKGLDILIKAFAEVHKTNPRAILVIAGKPWEKWDKYQEIIKAKKLEPYIKTHLNYIPERLIEEYFKASDVVTLPYKEFDSQSGAGSLALSFKKPMVVTNVGGLPELTSDKRVICNPGDPQDLAKKLIRVLKDDNLINKLEKNSARLAKNLSWDNIGQQTISVYRKLLV